MFDVIALYVLAFCRVAIALVFALSFVSKARSIKEFTQTITHFAILPQWLSTTAAVLFSAAELAVVALMLLGGAALIPGFVLAVLLLLIFSTALVSVLAHGISTPCRCFGSSDQLVSFSDLWRNVGFILCAVAGFGVAAGGNGGSALGVAEWGLVGIFAVVCVAIWLQLGSVIHLMQRR